MLQLLIVGAGGHAQVVADIALSLARAGKEIELVGFIDDNASLWNKRIFGLPVLGPARMIPNLHFDALVIGIGNNALRRQLACHWLHAGVEFATLVHPSAVVAHDVAIGTGTVLCAGTIVNTGCSIGSNVILNTACSVDHHNKIGDYAHIAPGAHTGGDVYVAEGSLIGIGAVVMPQRCVAEWATVGAGAVVTHHIAANQTVIGIPARPMEHSS